MWKINTRRLFNKVPARFHVVFAASLGLGLFGYDQGLYGGVIINSNFLNYFHHPSDTLLGQVQASFDLGCFVGALFVGWYGDTIGRKLSILLGCFLHIVGGVLQTASENAAMLIAGRVIAGLGTGIITSTFPVWQAEACGPLVRGPLILTELGIVAVGASIAGWVNVGCRFVDSTFAWRFPMSLQILLAIGCALISSYLPESPRWLVFRDRMDEAEDAISLLLAREINDPEVQALKNEIQVTIEHERLVAMNTTWKDMFRNDETQNLRRIMLGVAVQFFQHFGGIDVINYYMGYIVMNYGGMSQTQSLVLAASNLLNQAVFTFLSILVIDRVGRRKLLMAGHIVEGISYTVVTVGLALGTTSSRYAAVAFMFVFISAFGLTNNAIPWLYPAEVNSQQSRFLGAALATGTSWMSNYIVAMVAPIALGQVSWRFYILFAVANFVWATIIYFIIVETAKMSLDDIDEWFARDFHKRRGTTYVSPADQAFDEKKQTDSSHVEDVEIIGETAKKAEY